MRRRDFATMVGGMAIAVLGLPVSLLAQTDEVIE